MYYERDEKYYKKLKAVYLVYKENKTQQEVSRLLNISRPTLSKMINEAIAEGMVRIEINDVRNYYHLIDLEASLRRAYDLRDAVVIDCDAPDDKESIIANIGKAAARYFEGIVSSNLKIGMSWGKTVEAFVSNLSHNKSIKNLQVVTLIGGTLYIDSKYHANILSQRLLDNYSGQGYFLYAPPFARSEEQYNSLMQNEELQKVLELGRKVDVAIVGIGASLTEYSELNKLIQGMNISKSHEVGGINAQALDIHGNPIPDDVVVGQDGKHGKDKKPVNSLFIGVELSELKKIKKIIALVGGKEKHLAIRSVLLGGYANILITDKYTAQFLIDSSEGKA